MEKIPSPEPILTLDQVMEKFRELMNLPEGQSAIVERELSDERGPYLVELHVRENDGRITEYRYQRQGTFPGKEGRMLRSSKTCIDVVFYDPDGIPEGGNPIAEIDSRTNTWRTL